MMSKLKFYLIRYRRGIRLSLSRLWVKRKTALLFGKTGDSYFCHCCGQHSTDFLDWSSTYKNVVCPHCDSQPRHRALSLYMKEHLNFKGDKLKFLHFAPTSSLRKQLASMPNLEYITADLNDSSVDVKIDVTQIPYPDNSFDVIFCNHVLEHVMDDHQAMRELFRVLKPGGWASLQVPISHKLEKTFEDPSIVSPEDRLRFFKQEDHVRLYGLDYKDRLEQAGFIVEIENITRNLSTEEIQKYGLNPKKGLYFGLKPKQISSPSSEEVPKAVTQKSI